MRIKESLESEVGNRNDFANDILKNNKINKGKTKVRYILIKYEQKGTYTNLKDISDHFTLVELMDSLGNVNRDISVVGYFIFDSNCEKALVLNRASLEIIFAPSVG